MLGITILIAGVRMQSLGRCGSAASGGTNGGNGMNLPIAILLIVAIAALTVYIFRHAMKKEDLGKDGCSGYKGCASCAASEYCNHITSLEKFADERDKEKKTKK